ncbi:MAG: cytotoxic translational repressor [Dehalococcoidia bacterium]|nr:cytotoxic translational repressor [Dehalococcoidia bacterium]
MPIQFTERFARQYERLTKTTHGKVDKALRLLDADFRHPGLRSHPMEGMEGIFEAYVDAKYRMTFERRGNVLLLRNVDNHDECLRNP